MLSRQVLRILDLSCKTLLVISILIPFMACSGKKRKKNDDDDTAVRLGEAILPENSEYYDAKPDIDASGTYAVFLSGREGPIRAFLVELSPSVGEPQRITKDDDELDSESEVKISPDGNWLIFVASSDEGVDLFARKRSDLTSELIRLTSDEDEEAEISIASDSSQFAFTSRQSSSYGAVVKAGVINQTSGPLSDSIETLSEGSVNETSAIWLSTDSAQNSHTIFYLSQSLDSFGEQFQQRLITRSGDSLSVGDASTLAELSIFDVSRRVSTSSHPDGILLVAENPREDDDDHVSPRRVSGNFSFSRKLPVINIPRLLDTTGEIRTLDSLGLTVSSLSFGGTSSGGIGVWIGRDGFSCEENELEYANELMIYDASTTGVERVFSKHEKDTDDYYVADSFCLSDEESDAKVITDSSYLYAKVNQDATANSYKIIYNSIVTGDNEVWLLRKSGDDRSIVNLSNNSEE